MKRPVRVKNLVHVFHAMVDLSCYRKGSLDFYDSVLMTGEHEKHAIRLVEKARKLKKKSLVVAGLPCLDDLSRQKKQTELAIGPNKTSKKTILIAPSWGAKGCFSEYGINFVKTLALANYHIIIRLHPHSYIFEPESVENWVSQTKDIDNVTWDNNVFGTKAMIEADILISDASSIRFDFAFLYGKPVITLPISQQSLSIFESDYMPETWANSMSDKIGIVVDADKVHDIEKIVEETISKFTPKKLSKLRDSSVANFGDSSVTIVAYLKQQAELLSMTPGERLLKEQLNNLKNEIDNLRKQLNLSQTSVIKDNSE
jgi:CDP-glycerol glycerophosphotransferase (TagB/SpsB family)